MSRAPRIAPKENCCTHMLAGSPVMDAAPKQGGTGHRFGAIRSIRGTLAGAPTRTTPASPTVPFV